MSFKLNNRLTLTLMLSVLLAITVPVSATWYFAVSSHGKEIKNSMEINKTEMLNMLSASLASPLWDLRSDKIRSICEQFLSNSIIKKIKVNDSILSNVVYKGSNPKSTGSIVIEGEKSIVANGKRVGTVYIQVSSVSYDKSIYDSKRILLYLFVLELIISFFLVTYVVYHFILFPLHARTENALALSDHETKKTKHNFFDLSLEKLNTKIMNILGEFKRYHQIVDENVMILKVDKEGTILHVTTALTEHTGFEAEELIWCSITKIADIPEGDVMSVVNKGEIGKPFCILLKGENNFGREFWLSCKVSLEECNTATIVCEDVTHKLSAEKLANTDELTGLMNRRSINAVLKKKRLSFLKGIRPRSLFCLLIWTFSNVLTTHTGIRQVTRCWLGSQRLLPRA